MAVQRGNVQCVQGAYGESAFEELDEIFYIVQPNNIFKIYFDLLNVNKNISRSSLQGQGVRDTMEIIFNPINYNFALR